MFHNSDKHDLQSTNENYAFFNGSRPVWQISYICLLEKNFGKPPTFRCNWYVALWFGPLTICECKSVDRIQTEGVKNRFFRKFSFGSPTDWQPGSGSDWSYLYGLKTKEMYDKRVTS